MASFEKITQENDFTIVEGTGHVGVGSIVNLKQRLLLQLFLDSTSIIIAKVARERLR